MIYDYDGHYNFNNGYRKVPHLNSLLFSNQSVFYWSIVNVRDWVP